MRLTIDQTEEAINAELAKYPEPPILPVIGPDGTKVGEACREEIDFFDVFSPENHPDIYDGLRGRIILLIRGSHVRIFEKFEELIGFGKELQSPKVIIGGPPLQDPTPEEIERDFKNW